MSPRSFISLNSSSVFSASAFALLEACRATVLTLALNSQRSHSEAIGSDNPKSLVQVAWAFSTPAQVSTSLPFPNSLASAACYCLTLLAYLHKFIYTYIQYIYILYIYIYYISIVTNYFLKRLSARLQVAYLYISCFIDIFHISFQGNTLLTCSIA